MAWQPGQAVMAKPTVTNINCGVNSATARGWITHVAGGEISFFLEKGPGAGTIEGRCKFEHFVMNFSADPFRPTNVAYSTSRHTTKQYPQDFFKR